MYFKGQSCAALSFEIPGVIQRLGISSLRGQASLSATFFFLITCSSWFSLIECQAIEKASEKIYLKEVVVGGGGCGGGEQINKLLSVRPRSASMSLPLFRAVFRHTGLYVSLPGYSPVSLSQSGLLILSAYLPLSLPPHPLPHPCLSPCNLTCAASLLLFRA